MPAKAFIASGKVKKPEQRAIFTTRLLVTSEGKYDILNVMSGQKNLLTIHPLVLAWVGDAVFASRVRSMYALTTDFKAGVLQRKANKYVSAVGQSVWYDLLSPGFTEEEEDIARRAKNAHNNTVAKNATVEEYKKASALEAVVGYHSLKGDEARIDELFARIFADRAR